MPEGSVLLPLIFVAGQRRSHEQKCLTLAKWLRSGPISERIVITAATDRPLMRVRTTPAQRASAACASNWGGGYASSPSHHRDLLARLKGIGDVGRRVSHSNCSGGISATGCQVGTCVGLVPRPYDSGESQVDQGICEQGNRRARVLLVEMAWCWLRRQPDSALIQWFSQRTQGTGPNRRARHIAIVTVA